MSRALLLVDLQNDYFPGGRNPLEAPEPAVENARRLLAAFREAGLAVFHVRHVMPSPEAPFFRAGTPGAEIRSLVAPLAGEPVVEKRFPNAFRETGLLAALRAASVTDVTVAGMMTHMCVDATVRAAADLGFACSVAADACATKELAFGTALVPAPMVHAAFLAALGAAYARVAPASDLLPEA